jgi:hypothetical protein
MIRHLICEENVLPHLGEENVLCEAVRFHQTDATKYLLRLGNYRDPKNFQDVIEAMGESLARAS